MTMVLLCLIGQQTPPDLNPIENMGVLSRGRLRDTRPNNADEPEGRYQRNLGFHTTSAVPQTDHLHATPN